MKNQVVSASLYIRSNVLSLSELSTLTGAVDDDGSHDMGSLRIGSRKSSTLKQWNGSRLCFSVMDLTGTCPWNETPDLIRLRSDQFRAVSDRTRHVAVSRTLDLALAFKLASLDIHTPTWPIALLAAGGWEIPVAVHATNNH